MTPREAVAGDFEHPNCLQGEQADGSLGYHAGASVKMCKLFIGDAEGTDWKVRGLYAAVQGVCAALSGMAGPVRKVEKEIMNTLKEYGIMPQSIASISTIKAKSDEPVVKALQKKFPVYFYTAEELTEIEVPHPRKPS